MKIIKYLALLAVVFIIGCEDENSEPTVEEFVGTYSASYDSLTQLISNNIDSVVLTITGGSDYSLLFSRTSGSDNEAFCNSYGTVSGFGTTLTIFSPSSTTYIPGMCDSLRVPRGPFVSDFVTHGDTIYLSHARPIDTLPESLYRFKLIK